MKRQIKEQVNQELRSKGYNDQGLVESYLVDKLVDDLAVLSHIALCKQSGSSIDRQLYYDYARVIKKLPKSFLVYMLVKSNVIGLNNE